SIRLDTAISRPSLWGVVVHLRRAGRLWSTARQTLRRGCHPNEHVEMGSGEGPSKKVAGEVAGRSATDPPRQPPHPLVLSRGNGTGDGAPDEEEVKNQADEAELADDGQVQVVRDVSRSSLSGGIQRPRVLEATEPHPEQGLVDADGRGDRPCMNAAH